jgi:redox-regulated HSP33 family molecular chaperone
VERLKDAFDHQRSSENQVQNTTGKYYAPSTVEPDTEYPWSGQWRISSEDLPRCFTQKAQTFLFPSTQAGTHVSLGHGSRRPALTYGQSQAIGTFQLLFYITITGNFNN